MTDHSENAAVDEDRSAGRWCAICAQHGGHHTDRHPMTFGSLFSGIGGMDLGLERAGWTCRWQVEIDDYCREVLAEHWPDVPRHTDIKELDPHVLGHVDLVAGGFPCPPVSTAGLRRGREDHRWLWPDFARVLRVVRPRFVLVENVAGLVHANDGAEFGDVLRDLAALGFDADWSVLPACALGAPHARERVFIVAHATGDDEQDQGQGTEATRGLRDQPGRSRGPGRPVAFGWLPEPEMDRVADGVPRRLVEAALSRLGNAVVPDVAEWIGRSLREACGQPLTAVAASGRDAPPAPE